MHGSPPAHCWALPVPVLVGFAVGPFALVPALIVACVAPPLLLAGAIWLWATEALATGR